MKKLVVIIEQGGASYGAYVPDLPGCVAVAETLEAVRQLTQEAILLYQDREIPEYWIK